jgi:hypothetical protein
MLPKEYARPAFKRGLAYEAKLGVNPFKFGVIGSTDSHTSVATTEEYNFFGKVVLLEPSSDPIRFEEIIAGRPGPPEAKMYARETLASGLAAVWFITATAYSKQHTGGCRLATTVCSCISACNQFSLPVFR